MIVQRDFNTDVKEGLLRVLVSIETPVEVNWWFNLISFNVSISSWVNGT